MSQDKPSGNAPNNSVLVIGAGLAGLTAAFRLQRRGWRVRIVEKSGEVGGAIRSQRLGDFLFEQGPTTVPARATSLASLIDDVGLRSRVIHSRALAGRRLLWHRGQLHRLPEKPPQLLRCTALSRRARLRLLLEPLIPRRRHGAAETLRQFGQRRLGVGATEALLDAFVTGIYAGDIDQLGVDAIPQLTKLEQEHGSLFRGLLAQQRSRRGQEPLPTGLISFPEGLAELPRQMRQTLEEEILLHSEVLALQAHSTGWTAQLRRGDGRPGSINASAVVLATPASEAARLLSGHLSKTALAALQPLPHPFVATVGLGWPQAQIEHPLDAFGLLCTSGSRLPEADILGVLFASTIFPGRAPADAAALTVLVGGTRDPGAAELDEDQLLQRCRRALARILGCQGEPQTTLFSRWPRAIPQYLPGHGQRVEQLRQAIRDLPPLAVAGNYLDGPGLEAVVQSAERAVEAISPSKTEHCRRDITVERPSTVEDLVHPGRTARQP